MAEFLQIPPEKLEDETLTAVLQDYVNREGTDYGLQELSLYDKVRRLRRQPGCWRTQTSVRYGVRRVGFIARRRRGTTAR